MERLRTHRDARSAEASPVHLPIPPTRLLGREQALADATALLRASARLITFVGPAGVGKTHLALAIARRVHDDFADGAAFVDLSDVFAAEQVIPAISRALGVREMRREAPPERLIRHLQGRHLLLVPDNFEQVLPAARSLAEIMSRCSELSLLVTSREALRLRGEQAFPIGPLALPDLTRDTSPEALRRSPAVALALSRIRAVRPHFAWDEQNARAVAELCVRLDGLPLAIELAAARCRLFSPQALLGRLGDGLEALNAELCDLPPRQRTLASAIAWSHALLSPNERRVFGRMAVFAGGCDLPALSAVVGEDGAGGEARDSSELLRQVASLVDKSLLRRSEDDEGELRLQMLETIRQFGRHTLEQSGEWEAVQRAHARYYLRCAEAAADELRGSAAARWLRHLDRDHENLRAALDWAYATGDAKLYTRLCLALYRYWLARGHIDEGRRRLEDALQLSGQDDLPGRARLLSAAGVLAQHQCDWRAADAQCLQSLALSEQLNDPTGCVEALNALARSARAQDQDASAQGYYDRSLEQARRTDRPELLHRTLSEAALAAWYRGDYPAAERLAQEAFAGAEARGDTHAATQTTITLTWARLLPGGDSGSAEAAFRRALATLRAFGDDRGALRTLGGLMHVALGRSDFATARKLLGDMTALTLALGDDWFVGVPLTYKAQIAFGEGRLVNCVVWSAAMEAWKEAQSVQAPLHQRERIARMALEAKAALGSAVYEAAERLGRTLSPAAALREPIETEVYAGRLGATGLEAPAVQPPPLLGLTRRETEVLQLVATGMSDADVAKALFLSRRTVETHLRRIYRKLGVRSRTAAARALNGGPQRSVAASEGAQAPPAAPEPNG